MRSIFTLLFICIIQILSAQFQNGGLDQWEPNSHPVYPLPDLVGWATTNGYSSNPAQDPFPRISVTEESEGERIFAMIQSNYLGQDAVMAGYIEQSISTTNLKSISYTSRCDSIHLLGRCLVQIIAPSPIGMVYSDITVITSDVFEEKTIEINPAWIQDSDVLRVRFTADGYSFPPSPELEGYAIFSIDEVEANYITSTENTILDNSTLDVFPNPSSNIFNIKIDDHLHARSLMVFNFLGREISRHKYASTLDLSHLENGEYIISIQTDEGILSKRITLIK